jgi:hypothetical protein
VNEARNFLLELRPAAGPRAGRLQVGRELGDAAVPEGSGPHRVEHVAVVTSRSRWLAASCAPKFIRASIEPVENQFFPKSQPATSGGSNRFMLMFDSGASALVSEKPIQPTSFRERTTYSTGDANRAKYELGCQNSGEYSTSRITHFMS